MGAPRLAHARVQPVTMIEQQTPKANVLVVLDTSGSMTGVPGGTFGTETEAGIDCDNGSACRGEPLPGGACPAAASGCSTILGTGCPAGTLPGGPNFVFNGDFRIGGGPGPGISPAAGFTAGVPNVGDGNYAWDTSISVQNGAVNFAGGTVQQGPFPGDACLGVPATSTWLYSNGNSTGGAYKIWEQNITGLKAGANYALWAYISNAIVWNAPDLPTWTFKMNGADLGPTLVQPNESATGTGDIWQRVQFGFKTAAGQTTGVFSLWDHAPGSIGDDAAMTQVHLQECLPVPAGACDQSGTECSSGTPCPSVGRCEKDGTLCTNIGGTCGQIGTCHGVAPTIYCRDSRDCPHQVGTGSCSISGDACTGWCPSHQKCEITGETCGPYHSPCPKNTTKGYCDNDAMKACLSDADCKAGAVAGACVFPPNRCIGPDNQCSYPYINCTVNTATTNNCIAKANTCNAPPAPQPMCVPPGATVVKMCRLAHTLCSVDTDCKLAGDTCGPATSRAVMAKRVLRRVIEETHGVANYGFMTFTQTGFYPYAIGAAEANTATIFVSRERLRERGCWNGTASPTAACTVDGRAYLLRGANASRYLVRQSTNDITYVDGAYCGDTCATASGTGRFDGAYYTYAATHVSAGPTSLRPQTSYAGRTKTMDGREYVYYTPNHSFHNGGQPPTDWGFRFNDCAATSSCGPRCGASWAPEVTPFLDVTGAAAQTNAVAIGARLDKASHGGVVAFSGAPTGCALENTGLGATPDKEKYSAYHYMDRVLSQVQAAYALPTREDAKKCRPSYVLLITDGVSNGPGDVGASPGAGLPAPSSCTAPACAASNPITAGCTCQAVLAAYRMRTLLGVKTLVVGFGGDAAMGVGKMANDNIARAGGTDAGGDSVAPFSYDAIREADLERAVRTALGEATQASVSTSVSASGGLYTAEAYEAGKYVFDTRVDLPSWKGHLIAYDISTGTPHVAWDAATELERMNWWQRRVYIDAGAATPYRIKIDPITKAVLDTATLYGTYKIGASPAEAASIVRWMLGDPALRNPHPLGAITNSTPIDVGPPSRSTMKGAQEFHDAHKNRPNLTYVGSDDGMLHAFFTYPTSIGGTSYRAGSEAFAFIPKNMLPKIAKLYARGGQHPDPDQHIYGMANSPKLKSMCVSGCRPDDTTTTAVWKTMLVMPQGFGGNEMFVLDITAPAGTSALRDPPFSVVWSTDTSGDASKFDDVLGETISVPAFFFEKTTDLDAHRLMFTSGYQVNGAKPEQGRHLVIANTTNGVVRVDQQIPLPSPACPRTYAALTDVATARDNWRSATEDNYLRLVAGYFGDTWGTLWRYSWKSGLARAVALGCADPLHFSPAVVQLDRDLVSSNRGEIFLVQVTNSSLDPDTATLGPSKLIFMKENADTELNVTADTSFGGGTGRITVQAPDICAALDRATGVCSAYLPANARPIATPSAVLREDGQGAKVLTLWFAPPGSCGRGTTYLTVHDLTVTAAGEVVKQSAGLSLGQGAVMGTTVVGGTMYAATSEGVVDIAQVAGITFKPPLITGSNGAIFSRFQKLSWTELLQ